MSKVKRVGMAVKYPYSFAREREHDDAPRAHCSSKGWRGGNVVQGSQARLGLVDLARWGSPATHARRRPGWIRRHNADLPRGTPGDHRPRKRVGLRLCVQGQISERCGCPSCRQPGLVAARGYEPDPWPFLPTLAHRRYRDIMQGDGRRPERGNAGHLLEEEEPCQV